MSAKIINKPIRGIRDSIPGGYILGRTGAGNGPPILLPFSTFTTPGYVANTTIQIGGAAGGDLSGTYPNPTVAKIQGNAVKVGTPSDGQVLTWVNANSDWEASALPIATTLKVGVVKPDGTTITVAPDGTITSSGGGSGSTVASLDKIIDRYPLDLLHGGGGGGTTYAPGNPPTKVQFAYNSNGGNSVTFAGAPANGNLLVAMCFNPTGITANTGWTLRASDSSGTDFGAIFTKVAGASESATQQPISTGGITVGAIVMWELNGQAANFFVAGLCQAEQTGTANVPVLLPNSTNCIGLSAVSLVTTPTFVTGVNIGTQDVLDNTNARRIIAGRTDLSKTPMAGILASLSASGSTKGATCLITA